MSQGVQFLLLIGWLNKEHYDHDSVSWRSSIIYVGYCRILTMTVAVKHI